ncbi:hypothetical protein Tco_1309479 [Tanacetum coccineum]
MPRYIVLKNTLFLVGGSGLYLVVDENEQFRDDNFLKLQDTFTLKQMGGNRSGNSKSSGRSAKGEYDSGGSDIYKVVKLNGSMNTLCSWL